MGDEKLEEQREWNMDFADFEMFREWMKREIQKYSIIWHDLICRYETTATSLSFTSYLIAAHPQVQDQICEEIDKVEVEKVS